MEFFTLPFQQIPAHFDEDSISFSGDPALYAITLSQKKERCWPKNFRAKLLLRQIQLSFLMEKSITNL
ncbi:MAG: hypothetical protein LVR00_01015 [Rhabdochlamydiaceae bacterium]